MISQILVRLADIIQTATTRDRCLADVSPYGKPPPGTIKPFLGIHGLTMSPVVYDQALKYLTTASLVGTTRVRPKSVQLYKDPYSELLDLMEKANLAIHAQRNDLMAYLHQVLADDDLPYEVSGFFYVQTFDMIPREVGPEWFSSEDLAHDISARDVGYTLTTSIRFPNLILTVGC